MYCSYQHGSGLSIGLCDWGSNGCNCKSSNGSEELHVEESWKDCLSECELKCWNGLVMGGKSAGHRSYLYISNRTTFTRRRCWLLDLPSSPCPCSGYPRRRKSKGRWGKKHDTSLGSSTRNGASGWLCIVYPDVALVYSKVWLYEERCTAGSMEEKALYCLVHTTMRA